MAAKTLCSLPSDLLILIFSFLTPLDLLTLRTTCKFVHQLTYEKAIWINTLLHEHRGHQVSLSSFNPVSSPSELVERTALIPYKLASKLFNADTRLRPVGARLLLRPFCEDVNIDASYMEDEEEDPAFTSVLLAPGGKYLFTCSRDSSISLWDLGPYGDCTIAHHPIAVVSPAILGRAFVWLEEVSTNPDDLYELRLIIRIRKFPIERTSTIYRVYDINPTQDNPIFNCLAEMTAPQSPKHGRKSTRAQRAFDGRLLAALLKPDVLTVWDIATNTVMRTNVPATAITLLDNTVYVFDGIVQTFRFTVSVSPDGVSSLIKEEIARVLLEDCDSDPEDWRAYPAKRLSSVDSIPVTLELPYDVDGEDVCEYAIVEYSPDKHTSYPLDLVAAEDLGIQFTIRPQFANCYMLMGCHHLCHPTNSGYSVIIANIAETGTVKDGQPRRLNTVKLFATTEQVEEYTYDFCPLSARLAVIDSGEVRILDYLPSTRPISREGV